MKVLLVRPKNTEAFSLFADAGGKTIPLGIAYIAAFLQQNGVEVKILDNLVELLDEEQVEEYIKNYQPDIVGISATTPDIYQGFKIAEITKRVNKNIITVIGGHHVTVLPEETLKNDNVDIVVAGEGEYTSLELVKAVAGKKSLKNVKGLYYKDNGEVVFSGKRELIKDLDRLPFPARELLDMDKYTLSATRKRALGNSDVIITGRGCPFNCNFCCKELFGRVVRLRSAKNIVDEIESLVKNYNVKELSFTDDAFTVNREHVLNVCNEITKRKINIIWACHSRVDNIDEELIQFMKEAGCRSIAFGIESGNQNILDIVGKKITLEQAKKAIILTNKYKIFSLCGFILGLIGDTKETVMDTINFARKLNCSFGTFSILVPLPGSKTFEIAKARGLIDDKNYDRFTALSNQKPMVQMSELTPDELVYYQKLAYRKFYFRPKYFFRKIFSIKSREDIKQGWRGLKSILKHQAHKYIK